MINFIHMLRQHLPSNYGRIGNDATSRKEAGQAMNLKHLLRLAGGGNWKSAALRKLAKKPEKCGIPVVPHRSS